jgi:regulator of Ty1 transposition protein 109
MPLPDKDASLSQLLADALPESINFTFYHISTPPTKCAAIFAAPQAVKPQRTYCESHFLNVSVRRGQPEAEPEVLVLAIEILIYSTKHLTTIFVSKADSTGYLSLLLIPKGHISPLRAISTTFITYLAQQRLRSDVRLVISLFAKMSNQYLFPGSSNNGLKHVSDDRQLVKWWCRVLDPVLGNYDPEEQETGQDTEEQKTTSQAYMIVPGEDSIVSFLPQEVRLNTPLRKRWKHGHPLLQLSTNPTAPPRCLVPHFPDDPKSRFLDELDSQIADKTGGINESPSKRGNGQWSSIKTLEQFWEMMAFRQECSSGSLTGFIWIVLTPPDIDSHPPQVGESQDSQLSNPSPFASTPPRLENTSSNISLPSPQRFKASPRKPSSHRRIKKQTLTGVIKPRMPRIKSASSTLSTISQLPEQSVYYSWPLSSRGEIVLDETKYKKAVETLLKLDFDSQSVAEESTKIWIDEVGVLGGLHMNWGRAVTGSRELPVAAMVNGNTIAPTNMLVTKKRKLDAGDSGPAETTQGNNGVNTLNSSLLKKKPKLTTTPGNGSGDANDATTPQTVSNGVNVLNPDLIKKTPKLQPENTSAPEAPNGGSVNVLSGGLVRKKPKPA